MIKVYWKKSLKEEYNTYSEEKDFANIMISQNSWIFFTNKAGNINIYTPGIHWIPNSFVLWFVFCFLFFWQVSYSPFKWPLVLFFFFLIIMIKKSCSSLVTWALLYCSFFTGLISLTSTWWNSWECMNGGQVHAHGLRNMCGMYVVCACSVRMWCV